MKPLAMLAILLFVNLVPAVAQGKSQGRGRGAEAGSKAPAPATASVSFGPVEIRLIREWFGDKANLKGLPPGLAKKESLPPGLARQLQKNGSLPPGLEKQIQPLPRDLEARLPRLPDGQRRVMVPGIVILIDVRLDRILDVLADVF